MENTYEMRIVEKNTELQHLPKLCIVGAMQKAGSSWFCNMIVDVFADLNGLCTREIRRKYSLGKLLATYFTPTMNTKMKTKYLEHLLTISDLESTIVFKTHRQPNDLLSTLIAQKRAIVVYIYRDPRDVILSALDHGAIDRARGKIPIRNFARLRTFKQSLRWFERKVLPTANKWFSVEGVFIVSYEELLGDTLGTLMKFFAQSGIEVDRKIIESVVARYDAEAVAKNNSELKTALHLNNGTVGRSQKHFSADELSAITRVCAESALLDFSDDV